MITGWRSFSTASAVRKRNGVPSRKKLSQIREVMSIVKHCANRDCNHLNRYKSTWMSFFWKYAKSDGLMISKMELNTS